MHSLVNLTWCVDMVVIRLKRVGVKNCPRYRVSVADSRRAATGKSIEIIGHYNPFNKKSFSIDKDRYAYWVQQGAQPSLTVKNLFNKHNKK